MNTTSCLLFILFFWFSGLCAQESFIVAQGTIRGVRDQIQVASGKARILPAAYWSGPSVYYFMKAKMLDTDCAHYILVSLLFHVYCLRTTVFRKLLSKGDISVGN